MTHTTPEQGMSGIHDFSRPLVEVTSEDTASTAPANPESAATKMTIVALYIDADNQSSLCAKSLVTLFREEFAARVISATIAGNNHGKQIDSWRQELVAEIPDIEVHALDVPVRKQAADIALIMELGANLDGHIREREMVVVVSRDDWLVGAAEYAKARGCIVLVSYADGEVPTARSTRLTTLLLPAIVKPAVTKPTLQPAPVKQTAAKAPEAAPDNKTAAVLAQLQGMCTPQPGGGYTANEVGQALAKLGYATKVARTRFLDAIPELKEHGTGPTKVLVF